MTEQVISERAKQVCQLVSMGYSINDSCAKLGISDEFFYSEMACSEVLEGEYLRARENRSHSRFEKTERIISQLEDGIMDPQRAKVIIDANKWMASKEKPKVYGDKQQLEVSGNITLSALIAESIALPAIEDKSNQDVIDVEPVQDKIPSDYI